MLLELEIENDAAFASPSTLSLLAGRLKEVDDGRVQNVGDPNKTKALTSALILGKNGSGKSTLVGAMRFISSFVRNSAKETQAGEEISFVPNELVPGYADKPTRYRVSFSMKGVVYEFAFSHDRTRIVHEHLYVADKSTRFRKMYERSWTQDSNGHEFSFGDALSGRRAVWQESTRENSLFISVAAQLNSEDVRPAFNWLSQFCRFKDIQGTTSASFTARMCLEHAAVADRVASFLRAMDINVESVEIEEEEIDNNFLNATFAPEFLNMFGKALADSDRQPKRLKVYFNKKRMDGSIARLPLSVESTGTRALFDLAGPLFDTLENGYCLFIDEINTSLHPVVVSFLINMFNNKKWNCKRAQLIFTSHDTSILSQHRMRRDQVWLIENHGEAATLIPFSDFSPRRNEALDKGYLGGRYGGIPNVSAALLPVMDCE